MSSCDEVLPMIEIAFLVEFLFYRLQRIFIHCYIIWDKPSRFEIVRDHGQRFFRATIHR